MIRHSNRPAAALGFALALALASPGCGGVKDSSAPSPETARKALTAALDAWKSGALPNQLAVDGVAVHPVDFQWLAGAGLESYEVGSESDDQGTPNTKRFEVTLKLKKPFPETKAMYLVTGLGPVWVRREEDFARTQNTDGSKGQ